MTLKEKQEMIDWINQADYEAMFRKMRFEPIGTPWMQGDVGERFMERWRELREEVGPEEHTRISKLIGWDKP